MSVNQPWHTSDTIDADDHGESSNVPGGSQRVAKGRRRRARKRTARLASAVTKSGPQQRLGASDSMMPIVTRPLRNTSSSSAANYKQSLANGQQSEKPMSAQQSAIVLAKVCKPVIVTLAERSSVTMVGQPQTLVVRDKPGRTDQR